MTRTLLLTLTFLLVAAASAPALQAADAKFEKAEVARKSTKPALVVVYSKNAMMQDDPLDQFTEYLKSDVGKAFAEDFAFGEINSFSGAHARSGFQNPAITDLYGRPITMSVWLPGAVKPLLSTPVMVLTMENYQDPVETDAIKNALLASKEEVRKWNEELQKIIEGAGAKKIKDKELNTPEHQLALAKHYMTGHIVEEALKYYETALKLTKKKEKKSEEVATLTLEIAEVYFGLKRFDKALPHYAAFLKDYKDHERRNEILLREVEATNLGGDAKKAKAMIEKILKNEDLSAIHTDANTLLEEINNPKKIEVAK